MKEKAMKVKVQMLHDCSAPNLRWVEPVNWAPANVVNGLTFTDGGWWGDDEQEYGLAWNGDVNSFGAGETVEVSASDLRIVSCGECRVISKL